jgi:hypothetical protein
MDFSCGNCRVFYSKGIGLADHSRSGVALASNQSVAGAEHLGLMPSCCSTDHSETKDS